VTAARGRWSVPTALALTSATFNVGMVLGPLASGWVGDRYGLRATYLPATIAFVIATVFIMLLKSQPIEKHDPDAPPIRLWDNKRFVSYLSVVALAIFAMYLAQPLTPNFLKNIRHLSLTDTGWIFSIGAAGNTLMVLGLSRLKSRNGFIVAQVLVALFALCMWLGTGLPIFMLGYFLLGGFRGARPASLSQARELVHESQMGITYGTMETVTSAITIITPPLAGFIFERDPFIIYPLSVGLIAISVLVSYSFLHRKDSHA
jgi:MFS family permease